MKYLAIIDEDLLSDFRIDIGNPPRSNIVMVAKDESGFERGIQLKPIATEMFVTTEGKSCYLSQELVSALMEIECKRTIEKAINDMPWISNADKE